MTAPPDDTTTGTSAIIAALRTERDGARVREAALAEALAARTAELAERKTEFDERIKQQAATVDVLKVMSASPGDPRLVLDMIVQQAQALCGSAIAALFQRDGAMLCCDGRLFHHVERRSGCVQAQLPAATRRTDQRHSGHA